MSKKIHVTMSPDDYAALQKWQQKQNHKHQNKPQQQPEQPVKSSGGLDGFTVFLLAILAALGAWGWLS